MAYDFCLHFMKADVEIIRDTLIHERQRRLRRRPTEENDRHIEKLRLLINDLDQGLEQYKRMQEASK